MGLNDDEFMQCYIAQHDWRKSGESDEFESTFQCLMGEIHCREANVGGKFEIEYKPIATKYNLGWHDDGSHQNVWRIPMKIKLPPAPQKNLYIKQILLLMPYDRAVGEILIGAGAAYKDVAILIGRSKGFKFGNSDVYAVDEADGVMEYASSLDGTTHVSSGDNDWFDEYSEMGGWGKHDGINPSIGGVKDLTAIDENMRYPMGARNSESGSGTVSEIIEHSIFDNNVLKDPNVNQEWWWAFNLSPECVSAPYTPDSVHEFLLWAKYDISDYGFFGGTKGKEAIHTAFFSQRNLASIKDGVLPLTWPEGEVDGIFEGMNIDGHGTANDDRIPLRPVICIIWKKTQGKSEDVSIAENLKIEPSELGHALGKYKWDASVETDQFRSYKLVHGYYPFVIGDTIVYTSDDMDVTETHQVIYPGYDTSYVSAGKYWVAMRSSIGATLEVDYLSNFVLAYRPFLVDKWTMGPQLVNSAGSRGTLAAGKITGHEVQETLYPLIAGIDAYDTGDKIAHYFGNSGDVWDDIIDKDLTAPPGAPLLNDRYIVGPSATGLWNGHDDEVATCTNPVGPVWGFDNPLTTWSAYVVDESKVYTYRGAVNGWLNSRHSWFQFNNLSGIAEYDVGANVTFLDDTVWLSERTVIAEFDEDTGLFRVQPIDQQYTTDSILFVVRKRIKKIHFLFGDGGKGFTEDVFELTFPFVGGTSTEFVCSDGSFLVSGDRICLMDGLTPTLYTIDEVNGDKFTVNESVTRYYWQGIQCYKVPPYAHSLAGDLQFAGAVETEDGFMSDYTALEYPYTIADLAPIASLSSERLLQEKNTNIRFWGIESVLKSFDQRFGTGTAQYDFHNGSGWQGYQNSPYIDLQWATIGTKTIQLRVRNASGQVSPIVNMQVEIVDALIGEGISIFIEIGDFTDGYQIEKIVGGREVDVESTIGGGKKYDTPEKVIVNVSLSGVAKTHSVTHPIALIDTWRGTLSVDERALPDDLLTLKFLEEFKAALVIVLEGKECNLLIEPLNRDRRWGSGIIREWSAQFVLVE